MGNEQRRVLIVHGYSDLRRSLSLFLYQHGYEDEAVGDGSEAIKIIASNDIRAIITGTGYPHVDEFADYLSRTKSERPVIIASSWPRTHQYVSEAMKKFGTTNFIPVESLSDQEAVIVTALNMICPTQP